MNVAINRRIVLLVIALLFFAVYMLGGFDVFTLTHSNGWLGGGLVALTAAFL